VLRICTIKTSKTLTIQGHLTCCWDICVFAQRAAAAAMSPLATAAANATRLHFTCGSVLFCS
jgi:hypothetical protein